MDIRVALGSASLRLGIGKGYETEASVGSGSKW